MGSVPKGEILSHAIFYLFLFPLFDLLFDFKIYSLLLSSVFHLYYLSYDLPKTFHLPSFIFCPSIHTSFTFVFYIPSLCSFVPFLLLSFHHLSSLPFPTLTTQHSIPCDSVSQLLHSPYYTILHITLSPVV